MRPQSWDSPMYSEIQGLVNDGNPSRTGSSKRSHSKLEKDSKGV